MSDQPRLTRNDIRAYVGSTYYTRGINYFEQGRVLEVEVAHSDASGVRLRAKVRGSGASVYRQTIAIRWESYGASLDGDCSCPVGYNCKHVAAACLRFQQAQHELLDGVATGADFAQTWLQRVSGAGEVAAEPEEERLVYILKPRESGVEVELRIARPLKTGGGLSKGRPLVLANLAHGYSKPSYMQDKDTEILKLLRGISSGSWPMVPMIGGALGHLALEHMLATGRCYWAAHDGHPLQPGGERTLQIAWREHEDGTLGVDLFTDTPSHLLLTDPPLYADPEQALIGPLDTRGLTSLQLVELTKAPRLQSDQADSISRLLLREYPHLPLPPPTAVEVEEIAGVEPIPCLTLTGEINRGVSVHLLNLDFDYAGHRVPGHPSEVRTVVDSGAGIAGVTRDRRAEQASIDMLTEQGFRLAAQQPPRGALRLLSPGETLIERASRWSDFMREVLPRLQQAGWRVEVDDSFRLRFESGDWDASVDEEISGGHDWFGLRFDLEVDGRRLPLLPIIAPLLELGLDSALPPMVSVPLPADPGHGDGIERFVDLPSDRLTPVLETLRELFADVPGGRDGMVRLSRFDAPALGDLAARGIELRGGQRLRDLAQRLRDLDEIEQVAPPDGLTIELRQYQRRGLDWLQFLRSFDLGGILADDMGLGKTVQTLSHILQEKEQGRLDLPALVVAPTSLIGNWRREAARFTPDLRVLILHGNERHDRFDAVPDHDLVLTTYPLLPRDRERLLTMEYHLLILDEAQTIKNPRAQAAQVVRQLNARHRLCLTGTPMENHLGELWALFDFLLPGFLGDSKRFKRHWRTPIEQQGDAERQQRLARRVAPFLLRRRKEDVLTELPPKTEIVRTVALGEAQAALYEGIRLSMEKRVRETIATQGIARSQITILDALLKLRQTCCDPRLLSLPAARRVKHSAKLELLMDLLPEQIEEGRRILLFSQFTSMLALIEPELEKLGIRYAKLTGRTRKRDEVIDNFRSGAVDLFLISLKAGGLGLNLTEADTVILYDPWWNPAVEAQAADRAHRIGQEKPVFVYKLLTEQTVEERILNMQQKKQALADGIFREGATDGAAAFRPEDIEELFAPITD
ncbi:MAG: DEAD/DEAH box helicase [Thiohalocapsa sp.]|nr:DEAD/DEAH box helicase [Thiohalocapsa sp.]